MSSSPSPAAAVDEGNAKTAAREWVGWEEEVVPGDGDGDGEERKVCYYLRCAPPQDGGKSERDLAVVGKYWGGPGNIAYSADLQFLLSLDAALDSPSASARVETLALEITRLRWKSRKEVMHWLTSLVSDPPYGAFGLTCPDHHDGASKDTPSTLIRDGENKERFTWICQLPHLDQRRKHYESFCLKGMRISVHDFVYIKSGGRESHVAYLEDMYEDGSRKNMVLARWLEKPDDEHGAVVPPDLYRREIFFGYGLQDLRVELVEGLAAVLNPDHFDMFKKISAGRSSWQPHVCRLQIEDHTVGPFDITQLQGYANQEIVKAIVAASSSSTVVHAKPANNKGKAAITGPAAENHGAGSSSAVTGDKTTQKQKQKPPNNKDKTVITGHGSSSTVIIGENITEKQKQKQPNKDKTVITGHGSSSTVTIGEKTTEKEKQKHKQKPTPICSATHPTSSTVIIADKTMEKQKAMPPPCSSATPQTVTTNGQTVVESGAVPRNAVNSETAVQNQQPPSGSGSGSDSGTGDAAAADDASTMVNPEKLFQPGCRLEALSQDSSVRGCWYKCVVVKRRESDNSVKVRYQDLPNAEGKGQLREWLRVTRIAEPDHLGVRLTKRPMLRPQLPTRYRKVESPVGVGVVVDARMDGGWWEGIVLQQETAGHVTVYLQGEGRLVEMEVEALRKSFEWRDEQWMPLDARKDVAAKINIDLKKKGVQPSAVKKAGGSSSNSKQKSAQAQKKGQKSSQKAAAATAEPSPAGLLQVQPLEEGDDASANSAPPRKRFLAQGYSFEERRLEAQAIKSKGPADEAARPVAEEGDGNGMSHGGSSADAKRCRVDPASSDGLNGAERKGKARKSSGAKKMVSSSQGSSQGGGAGGSGSGGGAAPVNPVPMEVIRVASGEAPVQSPVTIDLTMYD